MMENSERQLHLGWWSLLGWLVVGIVLESLHGFKFGWYLSADNETRRLMFRLAHAHGTLLALVNIAAGITARIAGLALSPSTGRSLLLASVFVPIGFLAGGVVIHDGDPGLGILLVPGGAAFLVHGVARVALDLGRTKPGTAAAPRR